jgi:hypothetical protein
MQLIGKVEPCRPNCLQRSRPGKNNSKGLWATRFKMLKNTQGILDILVVE